jgi:ADP-ribose pyrophosphatase
MKTVFKGPVFSIESGMAKEPGGVRARRDVVRHSSSVAILPVHDDGSVTLIRQYRYAFAKAMIELPAGRIDKGETPLAAAKRELSEEIGLGARKWSRMIRILPTPGFCDETVTIFKATGFYPKSATPDADERIEATQLRLEEALALVARGVIEDAKTVAALLFEARRNLA